MNNELFSYPEGKTDYQITNEDGEKTTIRLEKWVADVLQLEFDDVHEKVQLAYLKVVEEKPELSRRQKGNYVRQMAENTANKYQDTKRKVLGWNDHDIISSL